MFWLARYSHLYFRKILPGISPRDVTMQNFLDIEAEINKFVIYTIKFSPNFKFHPGDEVVMKLSRGKVFKDKLSITGYDEDEPKHTIKMATTKPSGGRDGQVFLPFYQLENDMWVPETQLALRYCPHMNSG